MGLGLPEIFAEGAAIGNPKYFITFLMVGWEGNRIATVPKPPEEVLGTYLLLGKITVNGPGQNFLVKILAFSGKLVIKS